MQMDETSCHEVEEQECGICHTVYMKECGMKMVEEMMPDKVRVCKNMTKFEEKCETVMKYREVEEKRPECRVEVVEGRRVMQCNIVKKMIKKRKPRKFCHKLKKKEKEEKCYDVVKLMKKKHEKKSCAFHPKTICH